MAVLLSEAVTVTGAVAADASTRTPTRRIDPELKFVATVGIEIVTLPALKSTVTIVDVANTPVAPSKRSASPTGMAPGFGSALLAEVTAEL